MEQQAKLSKEEREREGGLMLTELWAQSHKVDDFKLDNIKKTLPT